MSCLHCPIRAGLNRGLSPLGKPQLSRENPSRFSRRLLHRLRLPARRNRGLRPRSGVPAVADEPHRILLLLTLSPVRRIAGNQRPRLAHFLLRQQKNKRRQLHAVPEKPVEQKPRVRCVLLPHSQENRRWGEARARSEEASGA